MAWLRHSLQRRLHRWRLLSVGVMLLAAAVFASSAVATPPVVTTAGPFVLVNDLTGVCPFTITVTSTLTIRETDFYDTNGVQTMSLIHVDEQDVFSANGKTLHGLPFTFEIQFLGSFPNFTAIYDYGLVERVPLPDGSLFLSAGWISVLDHPGIAFLLTPDRGHSGNVADFCAALSR